MTRYRPSIPRPPSSLSAALPQLAPDLLEAKAKALLGALGALELSVGRRLLPPSPDDVHPAFEILLSIDRKGAESEAPPPQAFDRVLGEGCSFRLEGAAGGPLALWLRQRGGGALCGWALPQDRWPSVALLARVGAAWDPGPVRLRVARRGMDALARSLSPPQWWMRAAELGTALGAGPSASPVPETPLTLQEAKMRVERELLQQTLRTTQGNKAAAARHLRLSRQGLYRKLRRHGLHGDA